MIIETIYAVQIILLLFCIYMTWRVRRVINGLANGLILLFVFLIVRRLDDVFDFLGVNGTAILSSGVVLVITYDLFKVYRDRDIYAFYFRNRQERIDTFDVMSRDDVPERGR